MQALFILFSCDVVWSFLGSAIAIHDWQLGEQADLRMEEKEATATVVILCYEW